MSAAPLPPLPPDRYRRQRNDAPTLTRAQLLDYLRERRLDASRDLDDANLRCASLDIAINALTAGVAVPPTPEEKAPIEDPEAGAA